MVGKQNKSLFFSQCEYYLLTYFWKFSKGVCATKIRQTKKKIKKKKRNKETKQNNPK